MTVQFLIDNSLIYPEKKTEAKSGRKPKGYKLERSSDEIIKWINNIA